MSEWVSVNDDGEEDNHCLRCKVSSGWVSFCTAGCGEFFLPQRKLYQATLAICDWHATSAMLRRLRAERCPLCVFQALTGVTPSLKGTE